MTAPNVLTYRCIAGCDAIVAGPEQECLRCVLLTLAAQLPPAPFLRLVRGGGK